MGQYWALRNLTDRVYLSYGKLGEDIWHLGSDLVALLRPWRNPFPNLANTLDHISRARTADGVQAETVQESLLLSLPDELFVLVASHCDQYKDYISLAETCMLALQRLAPITAQVRSNVTTAMGHTPHPCRSWSGKRIMFVGDYTTGTGWLSFKEHARSNIHAASQRRGCLELEDDIARELRTFLDIGSPNDDVETYDDGDDDDGSSATEEPDMTTQASSDQADLDRDLVVAEQETPQVDSYKGEADLYESAVPEIEERAGKLQEFLRASRFDLEKRTFVQLPVRRQLAKLQKKIEARDIRREDDYSEDDDRWEAEMNEDDELDRLREELRARERLGERMLEGETRIEMRRRLYIENTRPWCQNQSDVRFRIVNLDTLEHLDSEVIERHCPTMEESPGFDFNLTINFVLACQIAYSTDPSCNMVYKGLDLPRGRWAGHRLAYEANGPKASHRPTVDVSLEMLDMALRVCIADGFKFTGHDNEGCKASDSEPDRDNDEDEQ